jgi:hypothetical protein
VSSRPLAELREPTKADVAASDACTRSGTFALGLCLVLLLLIPSWLSRPSEIALRRYVVYRWLLTVRLDGLDNDPFWQSYRDTDPSAETKPVASLLGPLWIPAPEQSQRPDGRPVPPGQKNFAIPASNFNNQTGNTPTMQEKENTAPPTLSASPATSPKSNPLPKPKRAGKLGRLILPPAPTGLTAVVSMNAAVPEIADIAETLKNLNGTGLLTDSRAYSTFFEFSIGRWSQRRSEFVYRNMVAGRCPAGRIERPFKKPVKGDFVPEIEADALLSCLTLADVRELAAYEAPPVENADQIGGRIGKDVDVDLGKLPKGVVPASIAAEALLLFTLIYFLAFLTEASSSEAFPLPGTLFGAFSKSRITVAVLILATCLPAASTLAVAIASKSWLSFVGSGLTLLASGMILTVLNHRSYFALLSPFASRSRGAQLNSSSASDESDLSGLS